MRFLLKRSLFCARALERHRLSGRNPLLSMRRFMCSQNNEFWIILVFGKTSRNFTRCWKFFSTSEFRRNLDGSFIYRRELGYIVRIIFEGVKENYSRGKRFSDNIWKRFTTDVYLVDFIFFAIFVR